ncbi:Crp/Fnr family transcriptional regulator [Aquimarina spongiae]|uniref:cAMP-binding domain of CRP or a regulatory subunit of cAMP-dependent protein kinases n=1 Tax=Aquimarina spongiae TaxID=570521 RepID=A0A1M6HF37_9FLAO|nr:Crp/Fnr family transcriptional regulator [Aquimarina spongiae]SHJ20753.1 cAMP-binding domain of CRP or a regulatory subunit of cAMP-dependent protein kinases [Aquimarina spongiae]
MLIQFLEHIKTFTQFEKEDFDRIQDYFDIQMYRKKDVILSAGSKCNCNYYVLEGCLHMYFTGENGIQRTVQFAIENWWMTDNLAFNKGAVTDFTIQAVENTTLLRISRENQEKLLKNFPSLETYFRKIYEISYGASLMKMKYVFDYSKEEIYYHFTERFPQFTQRVPQYLIASYLGLTPEYVSEIRAKNRS